MTTAVSGLTAQAAAMSNISNNIANAQTVGFKAVDTTFSDLVNQSSAISFDGGGAISTPSYTVNTQGSLVAAGESTDLGISGNGFFAVKTATLNPNGGVNFSNDTQYTRRGDFSLDKNGYLVNATGSYLQGYSVDPTTQAVDTSKMQPIQVSQLLDNPVATSSITLDANLPANALNSSQTGYTPFSPSTLQVYDATGNTHTVSLGWTKTAAGAWTLDVQAPDATGGFDQSLDLTFGTSAGGTAGTLQTVTNAGGGTTFTVPSGAAAAAGQPATASFTVDFGSGPQTMTLNLGTFNQSSGLTQFSSTNATQVNVNSVTQNGLPPGSYKSLSIDQNGFVTINYDNGQNKTFFQIPIVQFNDPNQLQSLTGGSFAQTTGSGTPKLSAPGANGAGTIASQELENSNVDIATEFTKMIQTQQVYSANSRAITTANDMLTNVINLVHA
jgi:flagellar hook protein FlgE